MSFNVFNESLTGLSNGTRLLGASGNSTLSSAYNFAQTSTAALTNDRPVDRQTWKVFLLLGAGFISCLAFTYVAIRIYLCKRSGKRQDDATEDPPKVWTGVNYLYNRAVVGVTYVRDAQHEQPGTVIFDKGVTPHLEARNTDDYGDTNRNQSANPESITTGTRRHKRATRARGSRARGRNFPLLHRDHADQTDVVFKGTVVSVPLVKINVSQRRPLPKLPPARKALV